MTEKAESVTREDIGHPRRWSILAVLCVALLLIVLDNTIVAVALPDIERTFRAGTTGLQTVVDGYAVVFAGLLIVAGVVSDRFGRRRVLTIGLVLLGIGSGLAIAAWSVWWLVGMRVVMGVGAALIMPATLAVLVQVFPPGERARAFGVWTAVASVGLAAGPVLGGLLVTEFGWAGVFAINLPVVAISVAGVRSFVPESADPSARRVDAVGAVLLTVGLVGAVQTIISLGERRLSAGLGVAALLAVVSLAAFVLQQRRSQARLIDVGLYRLRAFSGASIAVAFRAVGTGSVLFVLTQYLQNVLGQSPLRAGLSLLPLAIGLVVGGLAGGRATTAWGARQCIVTGLVVTAAGFATLVGLGPTGDVLLLSTGLALIGFGNGFAGPAATSTVLGAVPRERSGMGSALNDTHQQLGVALGVAGLGSVLSAVYAARVTPGVPDSAAGSLSSTLGYVASHPGGPATAEAAKSAFLAAQSTVLVLAGLCSLAGAVLGWAILRDRSPRAVVSESGDAARDGRRSRPPCSTGRRPRTAGLPDRHDVTRPAASDSAERPRSG